MKRIRFEKALNESFGAWKIRIILNYEREQMLTSGASGKALTFHA